MVCVIVTNYNSYHRSGSYFQYAESCKERVYAIRRRIDQFFILDFGFFRRPYGFTNLFTDIEAFLTIKFMEHPSFKHVTMLVEGISINGNLDFNCPPGPAFMGMKAWTTSDEEAADMMQVIGEELGFKVTGNIQIYYTDPVDPPPEKNPYGYDINFTPFEND